MKLNNILILADMPEKLEQLLSYGMQFSDFVNAQVFIQYAYAIPPELVEDVYVPENSVESLRIEAIDTWNRLELEMGLPRNTPHIEVSVGNTLHRMNQLIDQNHIDLVLVSNKYQHGWFTQLLETTNIEIIRHAHCPVLSLPEIDNFKPFFQLALASDLKETEENVLHWLIDFIQIFDAETDVVHVDQKYEQILAVEKKLDTVFQPVTHQFHHVVSQEVDKGICQYLAGHNHDLVVLIPRSHSFLEKLVGKSITREVAAKVRKPILTIHESHLS